MQFKYASIQAIRDEGVTPEQATDERISSVIAFQSAKINRLTDQFFEPVRTSKWFDGTGHEYLSYPNLIPIVKLVSIESGDYVSTEPEEIVEFAITDRRMIEWMEGRFAEVRRNYLVDAVTGWVDEFEFSATTVSTIENEAVSVTLSTVDGLKVGSVVEIGSTPLRVFVNSVRAASLSITFDKVTLVTPIASLTSTISYGAVPDLIQRAVNIIVVRALPKVASDEYEEFEFTERIKRESVDNYSYTLFTPRELGTLGAEGEAVSTGSVEADDILQLFSKPNIPVWI